jgi:hypothetical protein
VLGRDAPLVERERVTLLEIVGTRDVLTQNVHPSDGDVGRQLLRPFHGHVVDWHQIEVRGELHLEIEVERAGLQLIDQHRAEHVRSTGEVELAMDRVRGALRSGGDTNLRDIVAVTRRRHRPVGGQ